MMSIWWRTESSPQLNAILVFAVAFTAVVVPGNGMVSLKLHLKTYSSPFDVCARGDVGLTDNSIQVQYRLIEQETAVSEWNTLDKIDPKIGFNGTLELPMKVVWRVCSSDCFSWSMEGEAVTAGGWKKRLSWEMIVLT